MLSVKIKKRENFIDKKEKELNDKVLEEYIQEQFYPEEEIKIRCKKCNKEIKDIKAEDILYKNKKKPYVVCDHCYKHRMLTEEELDFIEENDIEEESYGNNYCFNCLEDLSGEEEMSDYGWGYRICPKCGFHNYSDGRLNGDYGY